MTFPLYEGDLPVEVYRKLRQTSCLAVDTETGGLDPVRDRLCLVQLMNDSGDGALVKVHSRRENDTWVYEDANNIAGLLLDDGIKKVIQYAQFDLKFLRYLAMGATVQNVYCTRAASKIARTYTDRHGLKDLAREYLGIELNKNEQTSDWSASDLKDSQLEYASNDILYLLDIKKALDDKLMRDGRIALAAQAMLIIPTLVELDLAGFNDVFVR